MNNNRPIAIKTFDIGRRPAEDDLPKFGGGSNAGLSALSPAAEKDIKEEVELDPETVLMS